jgi:hypothetical protein
MANLPLELCCSFLFTGALLVFVFGTCCTIGGWSEGEVTFIAVILSTTGGGCCTETTAGVATSVGEVSEGVLATTGAAAVST